MEKPKFSRKDMDIISDLPESIIEIILTKLPIRDAVRTSILSTTWRYQWATMTQLVFDKNCVLKPFTQQKLASFVMSCLLLHDGPIHKFKLSTPYLYKYPQVDPGFQVIKSSPKKYSNKAYGIYQYLRFLSRKDLKELDLVVVRNRNYLPAPSHIFSCQQLTSLTLSGFRVNPPPRFRGFPCLKYLDLTCTGTLEVIENLISGCPLLESFKFSNKHHLALTIKAPNLKHLTVDGTFKDVYLKHTPLLADISINFFSEAWKGDVFVKLPAVTYNYLKFIKVGSINFEEMNEVLYVRHLLLQSPNLQKLHIKVSSSEARNPNLWGQNFIKDKVNTNLAEPMGHAQLKAADFDFWERDFPLDFNFKHLKTVKMSCVSNEYDKSFIKFVLGRSPMLQMMSVSLSRSCTGEMNMMDEVLHFTRLSSKTNINFFEAKTHRPSGRQWQYDG